MKKNEIRIGSLVWIIESWTEDIHCYKVEEFISENGDKCVKLHGAQHGVYGTVYRKISEVWPSYEAASEERKYWQEAVKDIYRNQIQTLEDLVHFMYDNTVACCEEYTDWDARAVAREKAAEFGIELEA